jgi:hypothetical protein
MTVDPAAGYSRRAMQGLQHDGAFVVQIGDCVDFETDRVEGRVEHVASGRTMRFESINELLTFMARVLAEARAGRHEPA